MSFSSHCLFLSVIYRPPNTGNFIGELTSHLYFLYSLSSNFILAGDSNNPNCTSHDNPLSALLRGLELVQHIDFPTHRLGNILDLIITPKPNSHLIQEIGRKTFDSDHYLILCSLNLAPPPLPLRIVISRSFENFDDAVFEKDFRYIHNTPTNLFDVSVEEFLTTMNNSFQSLIDHHAPFRTHLFRTSSHSHHKLSTDAIAAKRKRRKLERKISLFLRSSKPVPASLLAALKESRKTARALIFKSRADYFINMLASVKPNSKVFWKTANSILHRSPPSSPRSSSEANNFVNNFSSFFKEKIAFIYKSLPTSILRCTDPILPHNRTPLSYFSFVSIEEVSRLSRSLLNKSSPLDLIPTSTLKRFSHLFAPIISKLSNLSFSQAIFPASFKTAQVRPKKGNLDPTIPSNYRPISNLSTISKIIERLVHSRITSHVSSSPNFNPFQSAYRKHHSTETTLLRITDSLRNICATGHAAVLVSLDLSAAFDSLDHNILIDILNRHFNISELALSWFCSYLSQRSQFVKMDNFFSSLKSLNSGVPQGSVLGPILCSLYTPPMCSIIVQHDFSHELSQTFENSLIS